MDECFVRRMARKGYILTAVMQKLRYNILGRAVPL